MSNILKNMSAWLEVEILLQFSMVLAQNLYNDCLLRVDDTECFGLGFKGQGQIYIKSYCMACNANSSYIF